MHPNQSHKNFCGNWQTNCETYIYGKAKKQNNEEKNFRGLELPDIMTSY